MKIKKFNAILAAVVLGGALFVPSMIGLMGRTLWQPLTFSAATTDSVANVIAGNMTATGDFTPEGKQVTTIPWRSSKGEMPSKATLRQWVDGDRTYYEVSGPVDPGFLERGVTGYEGPWGNYFACEAYFDRGGGAYDQWIINPKEPLIFHFSGPCQGKGRSYLPTSRFQMKVNNDRITITFWCHNNDTPRNIVFNYTDPTLPLPDGLSWVATDLNRNHQLWTHHQPNDWTNP